MDVQGETAPNDVANRTIRATVTLERRVAICDACQARRSESGMDMHLGIYVGEGSHTDDTGYTVIVSRYSQFADAPIRSGDKIVFGDPR